MENLRNEGVTNAAHHAICAWAHQSDSPFHKELYKAIINLSVYYNALFDGTADSVGLDGRLDLEAIYNQQTSGSENKTPKKEDLN